MNGTVAIQRVGWPALVLSISALVLSSVAGCGGGTSSEDLRKKTISVRGRFARLVGEVSPGTETVERFKAVFAQGAVPSEMKKYGPPLRFRLSGDPEISGSVATFAVEAYEVAEVTDEETPRGTTTWKAEKDSQGRWKLTDVPLP